MAKELFILTNWLLIWLLSIWLRFIPLTSYILSVKVRYYSLLFVIRFDLKPADSLLSLSFKLNCFNNNRCHWFNYLHIFAFVWLLRQTSLDFYTSTDVYCMHNYRTGLLYDENLIPNGLQSNNNGSQSFTHKCITIVGGLWFLHLQNVISGALVTWEGAKRVKHAVWQSCRPASAWNLGSTHVQCKMSYFLFYGNSEAA